MGLLSELIFTAVSKAIARADKFAREKLEKAEEPPKGIEPFAVFEGRITLNQLSAPAMSGEYEFGKYLPEEGRYELKEPEKGKPRLEPTRLTTFIDDDDGVQQMTVRWEKARGKVPMAKARKDEVWRIEFYKVADAKETASPTMPGTKPEGFAPFGGTGGGFS